MPPAIAARGLLVFTFVFVLFLVLVSVGASATPLPGFPRRFFVVDSLRFIDPCLVKRTWSSGNYPGPMKRPVPSQLPPSPKGSGANDPTTGWPAPDGRPGQAVPHGTSPTVN